jgi:hypothetical protein
VGSGAAGSWIAGVFAASSSESGLLAAARWVVGGATSRFAISAELVLWLASLPR